MAETVDTNTLQAVLDEIHARFEYRADREVWGVIEHWETDDQIPDTGPIIGDCDAFAIACRKALRMRGIPSRLIFCGVSNPRGDHLICECSGYLLDNRSKWITPWDKSRYTLISISGYNPGDDWRRIA